MNIEYWLQKNRACRTSPLEAAGLGTIGPLADRQDNNFDPGVCVQLEQAKEQAYLPLREEKGKGKVKDKFPVRPSCSPLENRRQWMKELRAKT